MTSNLHTVGSVGYNRSINQCYALVYNPGKFMILFKSICCTIELIFLLNQQNLGFPVCTAIHPLERVRFLVGFSPINTIATMVAS